MAAFRDLVLKAYEGHGLGERGPRLLARLDQRTHGRRGPGLGVDVTKPKQKAQAQALLDWLLAEDEYGNDFATLRAAGVWRRGAGDDTRADAACVYRPDGQTWERASTFRMSGVWQWLPTTDTGGGCNTNDHTYVAALLPGFTDAVSFAVQEAKRSDNSAAVTARIRRLV